MTKDNIKLTEQEKINCYLKQINEISTPEIREVLTAVISKTPTEIFLLPASSTGKYHPSFSLGYSGLLRHQIAAFEIGKRLLRNETICNSIGLTKDRLTQVNQDLMLAATLVHDNGKYGMDEKLDYSKLYTKGTHPILLAEIFAAAEIGLLGPTHLEYANKILTMAMSHMGQWNTGRGIPEPLPKPSTPEQVFVHMADYMSADKTGDVVTVYNAPHNADREHYVNFQTAGKSNYNNKVTPQATNTPTVGGNTSDMATKKQVNFIKVLVGRNINAETLVADALGRPVRDWDMELTAPTVTKIEASKIIGALK